MRHKHSGAWTDMLAALLVIQFSKCVEQGCASRGRAKGGMLGSFAWSLFPRTQWSRSGCPQRPGVECPNGAVSTPQNLLQDLLSYSRSFHVYECLTSQMISASRFSLCKQFPKCEHHLSPVIPSTGQIPRVYTQEQVQPGNLSTQQHLLTDL